MKFGQPSKKSTTSRARRARLQLEALEARLALYSASGNAWPTPQLITISFVPDGTNLNGQSSNLFATFNARFGSPATWQNQILKAAQQWAQQTNINFAVVSDNGADGGSAGDQQGDSNFGDIRIGGYNLGSATLAQAHLPPPVNNYSVAGDMQFNTAQTWNIGSTYDLYTVAMHEFGHALGLYHGASGACMYGSYSAAKGGLAADDLSGIRDIYSNDAVRAKDAYDASASNETSSTARVITSSISATTKAGVINNLDLSTTADVDWYKFVVPSGSSPTLTVKAMSGGISLLNPKIEIYNSAVALKASDVAGAYGGAAEATITGVAAGQTYYVKVSSTDTFSPAFKTGRYSLVLNMGTGADPSPTIASTELASGTPRSAGGGQAVVLGYTDSLVNAPSANAQQTSGNGHRAVATDGLGNFVVTWSSSNQDGSGWGVYARRFDPLGQPRGAEFLVNTTTAGNQTLPTVAMDSSGNFIIAWTGTGQVGTGLDVYARRFDSDGVAQGDEFVVSSDSAGDQTDAAVAVDKFGNFVVAWASRGSNDWDVFARRFDGTGAVGDQFRVNSTTAGDQTDPSVGMDPLGNFVIAWTSAGQEAGLLGLLGQGNSSLGVFAKRYGVLDSLLTLEFRVNTTTAGDQRDPSVAVDRNGNFVIAWASNNQDGSGWGVVAQRYLGLEVPLPLGGEIEVNSSTAGNQFDPSVACDSNGNPLITWTSAGPAGLEIRGQLFEALSGNWKEGELAINFTTQGDQATPSIAISALGQAVVVWGGNGPEDTSGVFFQRLDLTHDAYHTEEGHCGCNRCAGSVSAADNSPTGVPESAGQGTFGHAVSYAYISLFDLREGQAEAAAGEGQGSSPARQDECLPHVSLPSGGQGEGRSGEEDRPRRAGRVANGDFERLSDSVFAVFDLAVV